MKRNLVSLKLFSCFLLLVAQQAFSLSLDDAIQHSWSQGGYLEAQETQVSLAKWDRVRRFVLNEPSFQFTNSDDSTGMSYGLSLPVSLPPKTIAYATVDSAKSYSQQAELNAKRFDLTKQISQLYMDCASAKELFKIQTSTVQDFETVARTLTILYETGHSTQAERIGADLQLRQSKADLQMNEDREKVSCKKLSDFLSEDAGEVSLPDDLGDGVLSRLGSETADEARNKAAVKIAQANSTVAWWSQLPDVTLSVGRNHYLYQPGSPSGKEWTTTFGVGITIPLFFPFYETAEARRAKSQAIMDEFAAEKQLILAKGDREDGAREYARSKARLDEIRKRDLALAEALVDATLSAYRTGKLGYAELISSRKTLADLKSQDVQLRVSIISSHIRSLKDKTL